MTHSEQIDQIAAALAAAQAELEPAPKDVKGQVGKQERYYADLSSCWDALRAVLPRHGIAVVQSPRSEGGDDFLDTMLVHSSGQWFRGSVRLLWGDNPALTPMQCYGSAITYGRRYGGSALTGLTTADDDGAGAGRPAGGESFGRIIRPEPRADGHRPPPPHQDRPAFQGTPKDGKQLYQWAKDHDRLRDVAAFGKRHDFPPRLMEWDRDMVGMFVHAVAAEAGDREPGEDG